MRRRLTPEQWAQARLRWETDPTITFTQLAHELGVSAMAVSKRARKEGWTRVETLHQMARAAYMRATASEEEYRARRQDALEAGIEERARILRLHKAEWMRHRKQFNPDTLTDPQIAKLARLVAEVISIRQAAERKIYGLDIVQQTSEVIVVEPAY